MIVLITTISSKKKREKGLSFIARKLSSLLANKHCHVAFGNVDLVVSKSFIEQTPADSKLRRVNTAPLLFSMGSNGAFYLLHNQNIPFLSSLLLLIRYILSIKQESAWPWCHVKTYATCPTDFGKSCIACELLLR
jgi:hypothetical protein